MLVPTPSANTLAPTNNTHQLAVEYQQCADKIVMRMKQLNEEIIHLQKRDAELMKRQVAIEYKASKMGFVVGDQHEISHIICTEQCECSCLVELGHDMP